MLWRPLRSSSVTSRPQFNRTRDTALISVQPTSSPQDAATAELVRTIRDEVVPSAA